MQWAWLIPYIPWIGGLLSIGCMLARFRNYRRKRLSEAGSATHFNTRSRFAVPRYS